MDDVRPESLDALADEMEDVLRHLLHSWYPAVIDTEFGGFYSRLTRDFRPTGPQEKQLVCQARHVWATAKAAERSPTDTRFASAADHGFAFLRNVMWDEDGGGFRSLVYARSRDGAWPSARSRAIRRVFARVERSIPRTRITRALAGRLRRVRASPGAPSPTRPTYGQCFGLFATAAHYGQTGSADSLSLARATFDWFDAHCHDPLHGGYLSYANTPARGSESEAPKVFDTNLHAIEALTELCRVWPDEAPRARLAETIELLETKMVSPSGAGIELFEHDWTPIVPDDPESGHTVSFGHDLEAAALLVDAHAVLGTGSADVLARAKWMSDYALHHGWDSERGGMFKTGRRTDRGTCTVVDRRKEYWVQAETLNTLGLLATQLQDDPRDYTQLLRDHWDYCQANMVDHEFGGWFWRGLDTVPLERQPGKAHPVRATYHVGRALMQTIDRLRSANPATS